MTESKTALPAPSQAVSTKRAAWPIWLLALLILLILLIGGFFAWQLLQQQNNDIKHILDNRLSQENKIVQIEQGLAKRILLLEEEKNALLQRLSTLDKQSQFNSLRLNEMGGSSRTDWLLAEAEYLLRLANQRLNIEKDAGGAEAILISADKVLSEIDDPGLLPVRIALAEEIFALQSIEGSDTAGLYAKLDALMSALDKLEQHSYLSNKTSLYEPEENKHAEGSLWKEVWTDLRKAVVIRRLDQPVAPLLAPEQSYYLQQNLRLMLEQASLALLNKDEGAFRKNIDKARRWLDQYFSADDAAVEAIKQELNSLAKVRIAQNLPDISNSLRLLKNKVESMYRHHQLDKHTSHDQKAEELAP